jgi:hypothetical protein
MYRLGGTIRLSMRACYLVLPILASCSPQPPARAPSPSSACVDLPHAAHETAPVSGMTEGWYRLVWARNSCLAAVTATLSSQLLATSDSANLRRFTFWHQAAHRHIDSTLFNTALEILHSQAVTDSARGLAFALATDMILYNSNRNLSRQTRPWPVDTAGRCLPLPLRGGMVYHISHGLVVTGLPLPSNAGLRLQAARDSVLLQPSTSLHLRHSLGSC